MGVESANTIYGLNTALPAGTDDRPEGDDHIRLIKDAVQKTFLKGAAASRPAAGTEGRYYVTTDTYKMYYDDGNAWQLLNPEEQTLADILTGQSITTNDTMEAADGGHTKFVDTSGGDKTINLLAPATAGIGWWVRVVKIASANNLIIKDNNGSTIATLAEQYDEAFLVTDGSSWCPITTVETARRSFLARTSGNISGIWTNDVWVKVPFSVLAEESGGSNYSTGSYRYTVDKAGGFLLSAGAVFSNLPRDTDVKLALYKNGSRYPHQSYIEGETDGNWHQLNICIVVEASVGDYFEVFAMSESSNLTMQSNYTWFSGARIK